MIIITANSVCYMVTILNMILGVVILANRICLKIDGSIIILSNLGKMRGVKISLSEKNLIEESFQS